MACNCYFAVKQGSLGLILHLLQIYVADPLPKMICHKCLYKLDTVYDFRHKCLEANAALKKQLLTMAHMAEVKQYLDNLESASGLGKVGKVLYNDGDFYL
jgi:hypothetical protein